MELKDIIPPDRIFYIERSFKSKEELLSHLLELLLKKDGLEAHKDQVLKVLLERESSMSTGIGQGIAIPHCSTDFEKDLSAVLAVLKKPIEFQAVDEQPVQIVILLVLPKDRFEKHIKTLAAIARQFNDSVFRKKVAGAASVDEVQAAVAAATASA